MNRKQRAEMEKTRLIMWAVFQSQSSKSLDLEDVMKLEDDEVADQEINKEELEELRKRAKKMEKNYE